MKTTMKILLVELTGVDGKTVWVNPSHVSFISRESLSVEDAKEAGYRHFTLVVTTNGYTYRVKETPEEMVITV